jgi:transcriptional regulator with XRE-family HTH domain
MSPEEIKALRKDLACTARELSATLELELDAVASWERGDTFPTKRLCDAMAELRARGPAAVVRKAKKKALTPMAALADPATWRLLRKILANPELRAKAEALAEGYADPAEE